jgi:hypothetical protein
MIKRRGMVVFGCVLTFAMTVGPVTESAGARVAIAKVAKACALLRPAELEGVLGSAFAAGKAGSPKAKRGTTVTACEWLVPDGGRSGASLSVVRYRTVAAARRGYERTVRDQEAVDGTATTIESLGDAASFFAPYDLGDGSVVTSQLFVRDGRVVLNASVFPDYDPRLDDAAKLIANYETLLGLALPRL